MAIQLIDTSAHAKYDSEMEEYREKMQEKQLDAPFTAPAGWPTPPKLPEPMLDSSEGGAPDGFATYSASPSMPTPGGRDPQFYSGPVGTPPEPKGYESVFNDSGKKPFTLKKK